MGWCCDTIIVPCDLQMFKYLVHKDGPSLVEVVGEADEGLTVTLRQVPKRLISKYTSSIRYAIQPYNQYLTY